MAWNQRLAEREVMTDGEAMLSPRTILFEFFERVSHKHMGTNQLVQQKTENPGLDPRKTSISAGLWKFGFESCTLEEIWITLCEIILFGKKRRVFFPFCKRTSRQRKGFCLPNLPLPIDQRMRR